MSALVTFHDLTLGYDRHPAIHHLSGTIARNTLLAVIGPNGAGKSTLFKAIAGLIAPLSGRIEFHLQPAEIAYLPQAAEIDRSFPINVYDLVAMGFWRQSGAFGAIDPQAREAIHAALAAVGLTGFEARQIGTLSGGQMQRALFARILLQRATLILLDEPFAGVDEKTTLDLVAIIHRWHGEGRAVLAAVHDLPLVRAHFSDALLLARECVAWGRVPEVLAQDNLATARRMCEAFDDEAAACKVEAA